MNTLSDRTKALLDIPDDVLEKVQFVLPSVIYDRADPDGFKVSLTSEKEDPALTREVLQAECWRKFNKNPQVNTAVRGIVGRITGLGFEATSEHPQIQEAIEEIELDWRNRLYNNWRSYVGRAKVEGELFLLFSCHVDGFIEVDFIDPSTIKDGGDDDTGIIFHPKKKMLPIFYNISDPTNGTLVEQVPSVFVARDPALVNDVLSHQGFNSALQKSSKSRKKVFAKCGGFYRFVVAWDMGFVTRRAISYLRTTLEWLNHYEDLKKYEIDHKKANGAYAWVFSFEDIKAFRLWMSLPEEEQKKTGMMQKIVPGSRLFVPPGIKVEAKTPNLPNISDSDTDIMQMAVSGLNEPSDVTTGTSKGTFASVKASRGPMSDRTSDEVAYFDRFYRYDFWGSIFWLKHLISGFPKVIELEEVIGFKNGKDVMGKHAYKPEQLVETNYPQSETVDMGGRVKAILGSKHGPLPESIGLPPSEAAKRIGMGSYGRNRIRKANEDKKYPPLVYSVDSNAVESLQEKVEGEKPKDKKVDPKADPKNTQKKKPEENK